MNAWNGLPKTSCSTALRPIGEAYIPIPKIVWQQHPNWVNPQVNMDDYQSYRRTTGQSGYPIHLHMPNGTIFDARFTQENFKSLQTDPQSILGLWILNALGIEQPQRLRYDVPATNIVTMELLERIGYDSIKLWHEDPQQPDEIWVDFAEFGSFERFINNEIQTTEE